MTIEEMLVKIEMAGFRVSNLFQFEQGDETKWQANIYQPEHRYDFAVSDSPVVALKEALAKALNERVTNAPKANKLNTLTLEDLGL